MPSADQFLCMLQVMLGKKEFLPRNKLLKKIIVPLCSYRLFSGVCGNAFFFLAGYNMANMNMSRINVYVARAPAGTSAQNIFHWSQIYRCGLFKGYDWGREVKNKKKHNQFTPPIYKIEDMNVPAAVWTGGEDLLSDPEDTAILLSQIKNLAFHKAVPKWAHLDFIWGLDAPQNMYNEIIALMRHHA